MKKQIKNPNKLNWKMYIIIILCLTVSMIIVVCWDSRVGSTVSAVFENLTLGALASALVALFIEIGNVNDKNIKSNSVYDAVYGALKFQIAQYASIWAEVCAVAYKDKDYELKKYTWLEWYALTKTNFYACDEAKKIELIDFFKGRLLYSLTNLEQEISQINSQKYILTIHDVLNDDMKKILGDLHFEFQNAKFRLDLENELDIERFWNLFDAINEDIRRYINNWVDIGFYNYLKFSPYKFGYDSNEIIEAILKSEPSESGKTIKKRHISIKESIVAFIIILALFILHCLKTNGDAIVRTQTQEIDLVYSEDAVAWLVDNSSKELDLERIIKEYKAGYNKMERETVYDKEQKVVVSVENLGDVYCIWNILDNIKPLE